MLNRKIEPEAWPAFFDDLSKRLRRGAARPFARLRVVVPERAGTQDVAHWLRLDGISYDRRDGALYLMFDELTHRAARPEVVWAAVDRSGEVEELLILREGGYRASVELSAYRFPYDAGRPSPVRAGVFRAAKAWWDRRARRSDARRRVPGSGREPYSWPLLEEPAEAAPVAPASHLAPAEAGGGLVPSIPFVATCSHVRERYGAETPG